MDGRQVIVRIDHVHCVVHGGFRKGAGRKRGARSRVPHRRRRWFDSKHPLHVTIRIKKRCWNLRSSRAFRRLRSAFHASLGRFGTQIVDYSVQGNHLHLIVESTDRVELGRAMKGLGVRIAKKMNAMMGTRGQIVVDRYHARPLRNGLEVKRALHYVLNNRRHHEHQRGKTLPDAWIDPYSTARAFDGWRNCSEALRRRTRDPCRGSPIGVWPPRTELLQRGWRRFGLLNIAHVPGPRANRR